MVSSTTTHSSVIDGEDGKRVGVGHGWVLSIVDKEYKGVKDKLF